MSPSFDDHVNFSVWILAIFFAQLTALGVAVPAFRIVTLAPSLAEIAAEILGEKETDRIVGVSEFTDFPVLLKTRPNVGSFAQPNREKILSLRPDLVLATRDGTPVALVEALKRGGINVVVVSGDSLEEVAQSFEVVGRAMGRADAGLRARKEFQSRLDEIKKSAQSCASRRVLLQFEGGPRDPLIVVGSRNFVNDAIALIGSVNVYADGPGGDRYPHPSVEDVIKKDPDLILVLAIRPDSAERSKENARSFWRRYPRLKVSKSEDGIRALASDEIQRPGPRLIEGIRRLKRVIHGDLCR